MRPRAQIALYAIFPNYMLGEHNDAWWIEYLRELRHASKVNKIVGFPYSIENTGWYNDISPWLRVLDDLWDLRSHNSDYWKGLRHFLRKVMKPAQMQYVPVLFPGNYGKRPFEYNRNGINGYWDPKAISIQDRYIRRLLRILTRIYSGRTLYIRLSNEIGHMSHPHGHLIGARHVVWARSASGYITFSRMFNDGTKSDFPIGYCSEEHGNDDMDRKMIVDQHGFDTVASIDRPIERGTSMTWRQRMTSCGWKRWNLNSDGSTLGTGEQYVGGTFTNTTYDEMYAFLIDAWTIPKIYVRYEELPKEVFYKPKPGRTPKEEFGLTNFERLRAIPDAWRYVVENK